MENPELLAYIVNEHVDGYYKEDELVALHEPALAKVHLERRDNYVSYIAGVKAAVSMLGYKAVFSDDRFPYAHIETFVKLED